MADKLRRAKDVLKKSVTEYLEATTSGKYLTYFEGSPTYITYFQIDDLRSTHDSTLEDVNNLLGPSSPNKYRKITGFPVWGVNQLDVQNELSERGLQANVNGEILILPNSIRPYPGDFISFEYPGMEEHLFRINDVQYDKISPRKFFRCQFSIFQQNIDEISLNISKEYIAEYDEDTSEIELTESEAAATNSQTENLVDGLIEKFEQLFYDEENDSFVCRNIPNINGVDNDYYFWSPYLQHFLHKTKCLDKYKEEILTEIYINDINEVDNREIYNEQAYRNSLFRSVELQDNSLNFDMNFLCVPSYDLKCTRNLPFFMSTLNYKLITPIVKHGPIDPTAYLEAFPMFFPYNSPLFKDVDHNHKFVKLDMEDPLDEAILQDRIDKGFVKENEILYITPKNELLPEQIFIIKSNSENPEEANLYSISVEDMIKKEYSIEGYEELDLFNILKAYLNKTLTISESLIEKLNNMYYKPSIQNYILLPLTIYAIKQTLKKG